MADFSGELFDLFDLIDGQTAEQILASNQTTPMEQIRVRFGNGWFTKVDDSNHETGKANCA